MCKPTLVGIVFPILYPLQNGNIIPPAPPHTHVPNRVRRKVGVPALPPGLGHPHLLDVFGKFEPPHRDPLAKAVGPACIFRYTE